MNGPVWYMGALADLHWQSMVTKADTDFEEMKAYFVEHNLRALVEFNSSRCPFLQVVEWQLWVRNQACFKQMVTWLVKEQHFVFTLAPERNLLVHMLHCLWQSGVEIWFQQTELLNFVLQLGHPIPSDLYMGCYSDHAISARLCSRAHARLLDTGLKVSRLWGTRRAPAEAKFVYYLWELRRRHSLMCVALISVLRRTQLRRCVNRDVIRLIVGHIWARRWDQL